MKLKIYFFLVCLVFVAASCGGASGDGSGSPEMTKNMLKLRGFEFNTDGFFKAIRLNDTVAIKGFFDAGMDPNTKNARGETALTYAIPNVELKTVKAVAEKADINMQDNLGQSALHLALSKQKEEIFEYLLEKGADVNVGGSKENLRNQTALYLAVTRGREDLVQKLLDKGADPNIADADGGIVLAEACIGAAVNQNIIKMLLDKGAQVNQQEKNGMTPLLYLAANNRASAETRRAVAQMLLDAGADKKIKDKNGRTPLDWAKKQGNKDLVDLLK
ncbi:MAG TPA: ankyrin repeat domain-containing protein [Pyrinomonadaceae bacterium]|nr:ankyrin repeat domain-containing protein [Pyrinomonadaceae bacterium]